MKKLLVLFISTFCFTAFGQTKILSETQWKPDSKPASSGAPMDTYTSIIPGLSTIAKINFNQSVSFIEPLISIDGINYRIQATTENGQQLCAVFLRANNTPMNFVGLKKSNSQSTTKLVKNPDGSIAAEPSPVIPTEARKTIDIKNTGGVRHFQLTPPELLGFPSYISVLTCR